MSASGPNQGLSPLVSALINLVIKDSVKLLADVRERGLNANLPGVRVFNINMMSAQAA